MIRPEEFAEFRRYRKDHVEVWDGQKISLTILDPLLTRQELAGRTVSVTARVEDEVLFVTMVALVKMPAQHGCATRFDGSHRLKMRDRHTVGVKSTVFRTELPEHVGECGGVHDDLPCSF